jgi:hypothetical protein
MTCCPAFHRALLLVGVDMAEREFSGKWGAVVSSAVRRIPSQGRSEAVQVSHQTEKESL